MTNSPQVSFNQGALRSQGCPCLFALACHNFAGVLDDSYRTLMMQEMIARGVLFRGLFCPTWPHKQTELDYIALVFDAVCVVYRKAIEAATTDDLLIGHPEKPVFRKKI